MDTGSTVSSAAVALDEHISLYTSRELRALDAELDALERAPELAAHPEQKTPAEHPSAVDHAPPARPRGAKGNRARSSRGAATSAASEASTTTERDVDPSEHARNVERSTGEVAELAADVWRRTRVELDDAIAEHLAVQATRPVHEWQPTEERWRTAHEAFEAARALVSPELDQRLRDEWRADHERRRHERDEREHAAALEAAQASLSSSLPIERERARKRRKEPSSWSQPLLLDTGTPRVSRADIATWDRALEGAPYEVIAAWTAVCEWVLAHPRNQGGEQ